MEPPRFRAFTHSGLFIHPQEVINAAEWAQRIHAYDTVLAEVRPYPGPKDPTTYKRTNDLFRAWVVSGPRRTANGIVTTILNDMRYFKWVHGDRQQLQHEETGWKLLENALHRDQYRRDLQAAINKAL